LEHPETSSREIQPAYNRGKGRLEGVLRKVTGIHARNGLLQAISTNTRDTLVPEPG